MNQRQELFCQGIIAGKSATQAAIDAGYSNKTAYSQGGRLLRHVEIKGKLEQLREITTSAKIMSVIERKERLSEIARARLTDFVECGPDGSWINIGLETANSAAIQEIVTKTEYDDNGAHPTVVTRIKLHPPVQAIAELNKMEGVYPPAKMDVTSKGDKITFSLDFGSEVETPEMVNASLN